MAQLSKQEFREFVQENLPDNSSREISALDLRTTFLNLAESVVSFLADQNITSKNFSSFDTRSTAAGDLALGRRDVAGTVNQDNSAFGHAALEVNFAGVKNTALGSSAASCLALGSQNIALGVQSLGSLTTGSGNLGLGNYSLMGNKFGNFNIAIGHGAGYLAPKTSEFKFYLGVYPEASGDCDQLVDGIDKPPLLYGDLQSLQLAIGASGFRGSEKLAVSGDIIPYENELFDLGSNSYKWDKAYIKDLRADLVNGQSDFYSFNITDGLSSADKISNGETIAISGISGIVTDYSNNLMNISAAPLSGQFESVSGVNGLVYSVSGNFQDQFNAVSGHAPSIFGPSGLIFHVSGALTEYADAIGAAAGAYTHWKVSDGTNNNNIVAPPNAANTLIFGGISGVTTNYRVDTNTLEISTHLLSGQFDSISGVNGLVYSVSGNLQDQIVAISGENGLIKTNDSRASGLISFTSGVLDRFIDTVSGNLQSLIHSSGDKLRVLSNDNLTLARLYTNQAGATLSGVINASGTLISGVLDSFIDSVSGRLQSQITTNDSRASGAFNSLSGIAPSVYGPSGLIFLVSGMAKEHTNEAIINANAFTHWDISDGTTQSQIDSTNTLFAQGFSGILTKVVNNNEAPILKISAAPLSGVLQQQLSDNNENASGLISFTSGVLNEYITTNDSRASGLISFTSGVLDRFIKSASGNVLSYSEDVSGVFRGEIDNLTAADVGVIDTRINAKDTLTNTRITNELTKLRGETGLSGILNRKILATSGSLDGYVFDASGNLLSYLNQVSGLIYNHDFFDLNGIVHKVSGEANRHAARLIQNFKTNLVRGDTGSWSIGDQTLSDTEEVSFKDVLNIVGKDGLTTFVGGSDPTYSLTVDAAPISGYLEDVALQITGVQGCFQQKINAVSGLININDSRASGLIAFTSGVARQAVGASGALISGWAHDSFLYYDNRASGLSDHLSGILRVGISDSGAFFDNRASGLIAFTSGVAREAVGASGALISGWAHDSFLYYDNRASGLDIHISGILNNKIQAVALASDAYLNWTISDGTTDRDIRSLEPVLFLGVSGIETETKTTGSSGIFISAKPLDLRASGLIAHVSGILHRTVDASGAKILDYVNNDFFNNTVKPEIVRYADQQDDFFDSRASGLISFTSGVLDRFIDTASGYHRHHTEMASGYLDDHIEMASGYLDKYIIENDSRASGLISFTSGVLDRYILATSGSTITSAGSGLVRLNGGEFNTAGEGNFERIYFNQDGYNANGQIVSDSGHKGITQYHDIINSSGYLVIPVYDKFETIKTLNAIDPVVNSGAIAFAGGHVRVSDGNGWARPPVVEGFMDEDLDAPTDYSNPTSGKLVTRNELFQASNTYYVTNRDHTFAASGGYFLMAMLVNNEYRPVWSTCSGCAS